MQSNSQHRLTVKYIHFATLYQETLWVIMCALTGAKRRYLSLQGKLQPQKASAYIPISEPGPYLSKDRRRMAAQPLYVCRQIAPSHLAKKLTSPLTSPPPTSLDEPFENMPLDLSEPQKAKSPDVTENTELNHL